MQNIHLPTVNQNKAAAVKKWLKVMLCIPASHQFVERLANARVGICSSLNKKMLKSLKNLFRQLCTNALQ
jgi:hypothetical protein